MRRRDGGRSKTRTTRRTASCRRRSSARSRICAPRSSGHVEENAGEILQRATLMAAEARADYGEPGKGKGRRRAGKDAKDGKGKLGKLPGSVATGDASVLDWPRFPSSSSGSSSR